MYIWLILVGFVVGACDNKRIRICEPISNKGCTQQERCTLDATTTPVCKPLADSMNAKGIDQLCDQSEECLAGLACIKRLGIKVCAQLCTQDKDVRARYSCNNLSKSTRDWVQTQGKNRQEAIDHQLCHCIQMQFGCNYSFQIAL